MTEKIPKTKAAETRNPKRSPEQMRADLKELWPAIPIAVIVLAWFLQPTMTFASAEGMASAGSLIAATIIFTRAVIVQREPKGETFSAVMIACGVGLSVWVFSEAGDADRRNQRQCAVQERAMLAPTAQGRHALEVYKALECRPTGIIPTNGKPSSD